MPDDKTGFWSLIVAVIAGALAFTPGSSKAQQAEQPDECPASSPTHRVGHTIKFLDVTGTLGETRRVQVQVWYPARDQDDCDEAADLEPGFGGCQAPLASYTSRLNGLSLFGQYVPLSWAEPALNAFENPRLAVGDGENPFPAIVFSHGNNNSAVDHAYLLEALASHGYIVAAPDHVNNTQDDVRIDFVNATAKMTVLPCFDGLSGPCSTNDVGRTMVDRIHDVGAIYDALPTWFGRRVDMDRVGIMGHSRGSVTALAVGGGSTTCAPLAAPPCSPWRFSPDSRFKAIMGLSIGAASVTFHVDLNKINTPTLLVGATLDQAGPLSVSKAAYNLIATTDKQLVVIQNAYHRHFDSALCAQTQSCGFIAQSNPNALLDLHTTNFNTTVNVNNGVAMDYCAYDAFTSPKDIRPIILSLTKFNVTQSDVPRVPLTSAQVNDQVVNLAVAFFGKELNRADGDDRPFSDCLPDEFKNQPEVPDPTRQELDDSDLHADDSD